MSNGPAHRFLNLPFNRAVTLSAAFVALVGSFASFAPFWFETLGWLTSDTAVVVSLVGIASAVPSFVVLCLASRCTHCGYKLFWHAVSKRGHSEGLPWFVSAAACPECGGTRVSDGDGMRSSEARLVAFDSNVLTFFLDANRGLYQFAADDPVAPERIAAFRLFLHCQPVIVPSVRREAAVMVEAARTQARALTQAPRQEEHLRFIDGQFLEFVPDDAQLRSIAVRAFALEEHHAGPTDCRILAEVEADGNVPVLVTLDRDFRQDLGPLTSIELLTPDAYWSGLGIPPGTPPRWVPGRGHPLAEETWWRW